VSDTFNVIVIGTVHERLTRGERFPRIGAAGR
jgi:hypothetical protein